MNLSKLQEMVKDREAWHAASPRDHKDSDTTERLHNNISYIIVKFIFPKCSLLIQLSSFFLCYSLGLRILLLHFVLLNITGLSGLSTDFTFPWRISYSKSDLFFRTIIELCIILKLLVLFILYIVVYIYNLTYYILDILITV